MQATPPPYTPPAPDKAPGWFRRNWKAVAFGAGVIVVIGALLDDPADAPTPSTEAAVEQTTTLAKPPTTTTVAEFTDEDVQELAFDVTWGGLSPSEQAELCFGADQFGYDVAAELINDGAGGEFDEAMLAAKLIERCA
jgi:hypothetical protein